MRIKNLQQNIKNFFLTNSFLRKIKNISNNFIKPILLRFFLGLIAIIFISLFAIKIYNPKLLERIKNKSSNYFYQYFQLDNFKFSAINISGNKRVLNEEIIEIIKKFEREKGSLTFGKRDNIDLIPLMQNLIDDLKSKLNWINLLVIVKIIIISIILIL